MQVVAGITVGTKQLVIVGYGETPQEARLDVQRIAEQQYPDSELRYMVNQ